VKKTQWKILARWYIGTERSGVGGNRAGSGVRRKQAIQADCPAEVR
jgi:hypothetical protein